MASARPGKYISKLFDKNILVLGGTSGIGFAVAEAAWEYGAKVIISGTNQPKIDRKMSEMKDNNPAGNIEKLRGFPCELGNEETMEANLKSLFDVATENGETKLDHIVFCSGDYGSFKPPAEADVAYVQKISLVRSVAPVIVAKFCGLGYIKISPSSSFTLTSSVEASKPGDGWSVIGGIFAAVEGLARGLAVDLAPIRVNCVAPGAIRTELFDRFWAERTEEMLDSFREKSTTKTIGKPEDVAEAYLYCMRDGFVTGTVIASDGGHLLV
jgi:NAD(P)-dependent dehydrogenase (short-subunit alcohol dehydrogenase family)